MPPDLSALRARLLAVTGPDELVTRAIEVAARVHDGAFRDEGSPYVHHPLRVALILAEELGVTEPRLVCAALLHDVLEDGRDITYEDLAREFGGEVAGLVRRLTDEFKHTGLPRGERKKLYLQRIAGEDDDCLLVKFCDRLDNLRSLPLSPNREKREAMKLETRLYLMPLLASRRGAFTILERLLEHALEE